MIEKFEWYPPTGSTPLLFTLDGPFMLNRYAGTGAIRAEPQRTKGPGQVGETPLDNLVPARMISIEFFVLADSQEHMTALEGQLADAFAALPARHGEEVRQGLLRAYRVGGETVEVEAIPMPDPDPEIDGPASIQIAVDFYCPSPYWRAVTDESVLLQPGGTAVTYPLTYPVMYPSGSVELEVDNRGDVDAPPLLRVYGTCMDPVLSNLTTGEALRLTGTIGAGEYVEIETVFGRKAITHVAADGTRTNWMQNLDLNFDDFWQLRPGVNRLRLEVAGGSGHQALVSWRPRWAGV